MTKTFGPLLSAIDVYKHAFDDPKPITQDEVKDIVNLVFENLRVQPDRFPAAFGPFALSPLFIFLKNFYGALTQWKEASGDDFDNRVFQRALTHLFTWVTDLTDKVLEFRDRVNRDEFDPPEVVLFRGLIESDHSEVPVSVSLESCVHLSYIRTGSRHCARLRQVRPAGARR
jgi:hypothetical protein